MGLTQKESLSEDGEKMEKCCSDCKTTKTPLWRGGPAGPKSLCNACGIRFRKRRNSVVGPSRGQTEKRKERTTLSPPTPAAAADAGTVGDGGLGESLKMGLMALTKEVLMQQQRSSSSSSSYWFSSPVKKQRSRRKLREEEQAAVLLMSLSCGSIFA